MALSVPSRRCTLGVVHEFQLARHKKMMHPEPEPEEDLSYYPQLNDVVELVGETNQKASSFDEGLFSLCVSKLRGKSSTSIVEGSASSSYPAMPPLLAIYRLHQSLEQPKSTLPLPRRQDRQHKSRGKPRSLSKKRAGSSP